MSGEGMTKVFSGTNSNMLRPSIIAVGLDPEQAAHRRSITILNLNR